MTLSEFKAWLDGFEAAMGDAPSPEQWAKIKAKLADVTPLANFGQLLGGGPFVPKHRQPSDAAGLLPSTVVISARNDADEGTRMT